MNKVKDIDIKFEISPDLDMEGFSLLEGEIKKGHPLFNQFKRRKDIFFDNDDQIFFNNVEEELLKNDGIKSNFDLVTKKWKEIRGIFLNNSNVLFDDNKFCNENIVLVYPTIWGVSIQNMEKNAISFDVLYSNTDEMLYVVMHELMHFFFFNFLYNIRKIDLENADKKDLWDISETFNSVVFREDKFAKLFEKYNPIDYPEHIEMINKIKTELKNEFSVKEFIEKYNQIFNKSF